MSAKFTFALNFRTPLCEISIFRTQISHSKAKITLSAKIRNEREFKKNEA